MLMKKVKSSAGTTSLYPRQLFWYKSIIDSLKALMARATFLQSCELWRNRQKFDNTLTDVYDSKVWHDFLDPGGIPFLSLPYNFAFAMNIDWFQPLKVVSSEFYFHKPITVHIELYLFYHFIHFLLYIGQY